MGRRLRLILLALCLAALVIIGRLSTGSFDFLLHQFWFTAGLFLLILLSLVDQPFFSKDANLFVNGTTAWVSLLLVERRDMRGVWWVFFGWATYLIVSSYLLMWIRSRELATETWAVQLASRLNRQIGRPEAIFSAFFLWGCVREFGVNSAKLNALFLYWVVFMILNLPAIAQLIDRAFSPHEAHGSEKAGALLTVINPRVAEVNLAPGLPASVVGRQMELNTRDAGRAATAIVIDDRVVAGQRLGRLAITAKGPGWNALGTDPASTVALSLIPASESTNANELPVSVVDVGTEIGTMVFSLHPDVSLREGEVVWVEIEGCGKAFYQVVAARVSQVALSDGNSAQSVRVSAGQLGVWDSPQCRFEPVTWVPPAGQIVHRTRGPVPADQKVPPHHLAVGKVPNSDFVVHVDIQDLVTHNAAIIGVTGSGKSYLAFHMIEAMVENEIKVLVLDLSRQHYPFLNHLDPTQVKQASDVVPWLQDKRSFLGIHQYASSKTSFPESTAGFVEEAFKALSQVPLKVGVDEPAKVCIVLEEAHSVIPEWNQVADKRESDFVNRTARTILQGRKHGIGCLVITQRTANVTKTILNQCNTIFALQSFDQTGLDFLKNYMGEEYAHAISTLPARHAILVGKASSSARPILFCIEDFSDRWKDKGHSEAVVARTGPTQDSTMNPSPDS